MHLDPKFYTGYESIQIESFIKVKEETYELSFSVTEMACLIRLKIACVAEELYCKANKVTLLLKSQNGILFKEEDALNPMFERSHREAIKYAHGECMRQFVYMPPTVIKLYPRATYVIEIEKSLSEFLWPSTRRRDTWDSLIEFHSEQIVCLTGMTLLKIPSTS